MNKHDKYFYFPSWLDLSANSIHLNKCSPLCILPRDLPHPETSNLFTAVELGRRGCYSCPVPSSDQFLTTISEDPFERLRQIMDQSLIARAHTQQPSVGSLENLVKNRDLFQKCQL